MAGFTPGYKSVGGLIRGIIPICENPIFDQPTGGLANNNGSFRSSAYAAAGIDIRLLGQNLTFNYEWIVDHANSGGSYNYQWTDIFALEVYNPTNPLTKYGLFFQLGIWFQGSVYQFAGRWQLKTLEVIPTIVTTVPSAGWNAVQAAWRNPELHICIQPVTYNAVQYINVVFGLNNQRYNANAIMFASGNALNLSTYNTMLTGGYLPGKWLISDPNEQDGGDPDDEDKPGGNSGTGGGNGSYTIIKDNIPVPNMPTLTAGAAGFVTLYNPSAAILKLLADELNSDNVIQWIINYFEKPQDMVAGLGIVPVQPVTIGSHKPKLGSKSIDIAMPVIEDQFVEKDCGTLEIYKFYGSAFDYSPYSQIQIFLPYIGLKELNVDEVMGKTIGVKYHIDLFTGNCVAFVTVYNSGNEAVRYQFSGNCLQQIPINATSYDDAITNGIRLATMAVASIATAGAAGAAAGAAATEAGATAAEASTAAAVAESATAAEAGRELAGSTLSAIMTSKPHVERSGSLGGSIGLMSVQTPFIVRIIPRQSLPDNYKHYAGYPSNITATLSSLSGFTKMEKINLTGISATDDELAEIYKLLYSGVIL